MPSDDTAWLDDDELAAWIGLIKLSARIVALSDGAFRRTRGITGRDYELLHHVSGSADGRRVTELAELIDDTSSCITHRVNRLCAAGLVDKRPDPDDARARRVALTATGRSLLERTAPEHVARVRAWILDPLSPTDIAELGRITHLLNDHLRATAPANE